MTKVPSLFRSIVLVAGLSTLAACQTMTGAGLSTSEVTAELTPESAGAISEDMVAQLAEQIGPGSTTIRLATSGDIQVDHVAELVNGAGQRASVINFPVHFPPLPIDGAVIAGWMPWRQLRLGCYPPDLYDRLKQLPDFNPRELAMDMALEARATEGCDEDEYVEWVGLHIRREERWLEVLNYLSDNDPTDLTAVLLDGPDKVQHLCWRFLDPALWPAEFGLDKVQAQVLFGAGVWPFAISIIVFSLIIDRIGYKTVALFAIVCHLVSLVLTLRASGFQDFYWSTLLVAVANGTVESFINPVVATVFSKNKSKWLNILHAGWPVASA